MRSSFPSRRAGPYRSGDLFRRCRAPHRAARDGSTRYQRSTPSRDEEQQLGSDTVTADGELPGDHVAAGMTTP
jgi:hypothetical protein